MHTGAPCACSLQLPLSHQHETLTTSASYALVGCSRASQLPHQGIPCTEHLAHPGLHPLHRPLSCQDAPRMDSPGTPSPRPLQL